jgi:hypothetical protein
MNSKMLKMSFKVVYIFLKVNMSPNMTPTQDIHRELHGAMYEKILYDVVSLVGISTNDHKIR